MNITDFTIRAGTSNDLDFQLLTDTDNDGEAETGIDLSAVHHVELVLINSDSGGTTTYSTTDVSPKVSILAGTGGSVRFTPNGTVDLNTSSNGGANIYNGFWWVYATSTKKFSVPEEFHFTIRVKS